MDSTVPAYMSTAMVLHLLSVSVAFLCDIHPLMLYLNKALLVRIAYRIFVSRNDHHGQPFSTESTRSILCSTRRGFRLQVIARSFRGRCHYAVTISPQNLDLRCRAETPHKYAQIDTAPAFYATGQAELTSHRRVKVRTL